VQASRPQPPSAVKSLAIRRQTLHCSERAARTYIPHAKLFDDNAAGALF
jgi:hypothetical protein